MDFRSSKIRWIEPIGLSIGSAACLILSFPSVNGPWLYPNMGNHSERIFWAQFLGITYFFILALLAFMSFLNMNDRGPLSSQIRGHLAEGATETWLTLKEVVGTDRCPVGLLCAVGIGIFVRAYFLDQPMRYDESFTFLGYVQPGLAFHFVYGLANNHVFHTLLVSLSTFFFGQSPAAIRMAAFVAGVLCIPAVWFYSRMLGGKTAGYLSAILMAIWPYMVLYSTSARGYSLIVLLTLICLIASRLILINPSPFNLFLFSMASSLGLFTVPIMVMPLLGILLFWWLSDFSSGASASSSFRHIISIVVMTFVFTFVLYTPVILATGGHLSSFFSAVLALNWNDFLRAISGHLHTVFLELTMDVPGPFLILVLGCITLLLTCLTDHGRRDALLLLFSVTLGLTTFLLFQRVLPPSRTLVFLLPIIFVCADIGYSGFMARRLPVVQKFAGGVIVTYTCFLAFHMIAHDSIIKNHNLEESFPEAKCVASFLKPLLGKQGSVNAKCPADAPLEYYLRRDGAISWSTHPFQGRNTPVAERNDASRSYFILLNVPTAKQFISDITNEKVEKVFDVGESTIYRSVFSQ